MSTTRREMIRGVGMGGIGMAALGGARGSKSIIEPTPSPITPNAGTIIDVSTFPSVAAAWATITTGCTLYFPPGNWPISSVLHNSGQDYVSVIGCGRSSRLIGTAAFQTIVTLTGRTGWEFSNLALVGPGNGRRVTPDSEGCGLQFIGCSDIRVHDCRIENCGKSDGTDIGIACIYLRASCTDCLVEDNLFLESNCGVNEDAYQSSSTPAGNIVRRNRSRNLRAHYIVDSANLLGDLGHGMKVLDNEIDGHYTSPAVPNERYGIRVTGAIGCEVRGNRIYNVAGGIELYGAVKYAEITDNIVAGFVSSSISGVGIWGRAQGGGGVPTFARVTGNRIYGAPRSGLLWDAGTDYQIVGNVTLDSPDA